MKSITSPLLSLLIAAGLLAGSAAIHAQEDYQPAPPPAPEQQQSQVSDADVSNFVSAYMAVQEINQEYTEKLQAAESPEQATELQQEAQGKMQEAVTESGLSVGEYQQIANLANQDPALRERITTELTKNMGS